MVTKQQAKIGLRVKWQSLDKSIRPSCGSIVKIDGREATILCDFPDEDTDSRESSTYLDSPASCWSPL